MKSFITFFRPCIILTLKTLWFVTRPKTFGACVLIICDNEVLLVTTTYWLGYGVPGGGIKKGESPRDAGIREVYEEVGIQLADVTSLGSWVSHDHCKVDTIHAFYAYVDSKKYVLDNLEIDTAEWFSLDALPLLNAIPTKMIALYTQRT